MSTEQPRIMLGAKTEKLVETYKQTIPYQRKHSMVEKGVGYLNGVGHLNSLHIIHYVKNFL